MPIYEYQCTNCNHQFDVMQKINEPPVTLCPQCAKDTAERLVSAAGFQLKGTGWYATDFKNKPTPPSKKEQSSTTEGPAKEKSASDSASTTTTTTEGNSK